MRRYSLISDRQFLRSKKLLQHFSTASHSAKYTISLSKKQFKFTRNTKHSIRCSKTEVTHINPQGFLVNKEHIRKLRGTLDGLMRRKKEIENPEYRVDLEYDIEIWEESVGLIKQQLTDIRRHRITNQRKKVRNKLAEQKVMYERVQFEIKERNIKADDLNKIQSRIGYIQMKNQELDRRIRQLINWQQQQRQVRKNQSSVSTDQSVDSKYQTIENARVEREKMLRREKEDIKERVLGHDIDIELVSRKVRETEEIIERLTIDYYRIDDQPHFNLQ